MRHNTFRLLVAAVILMPASVLAQNVLEEVVVTAQKRTEALQDIGAAVTALTADELSRLRVREGRDLFERLANVSLMGNVTEAQLQVNMRGIGFPNFSPIAVQPVGLFADEVNWNSPNVAGLFIYDLERVEVVRGPQNTLYGRNTTAGAVNFITRKPVVGEGVKGNLEVGYGRFDHIDADVGVSFPLGETAAARVAFNSQDRDGQWDNLTTGEDVSELDKKAVRIQLVWEPREDISTLLNYHWGEHDGDSRLFKSIGLLDPANPNPFTVSLSDGLFGNCPDPNLGSVDSNCVAGVGFAGVTPGPLNVSDYDDVFEDNRDMVDRVEASGASFRVEWELPWMTVTSLTAFETSEYFHAEGDGLPVDNFNFYQNNAQQQWSQEFRFASPEDQQLRWITGAYYFEEDTQTEVIVSLPFAMMGMGGGMSSQLTQTDSVYAGFAEFEYDLTDQWTAIIGGRYSSDKKEGWARVVATTNTQNIEQLSVGGDNSEPLRYQTIHDLGGFQFVPFITFEESWDDWGAKFALEYKHSDDVLLYASASRGIKAGGFPTGPNIIFADIAGSVSTGPGDGLFNNPVDPETVWAFEAGLKGEYFDNTLRANISGFYQDYSDMQVQAFFLFPQPVGPAVLEGRLLTVGDTTTAGIELELLWLPPQIEGATLSFNGGWLTTEVDKDATGIGLEGNDLPNSPEFTFQVTAEKQWNLNLIGDDLLSVVVDGHYSASREFHITNNPFLDDPSFFVLNVSGHYEFGPDQRYRISVWGKDVTDADYYNNMIELGFGDVVAYQNNAQSFGVTFAASFE